MKKQKIKSTFSKPDDYKMIKVVSSKYEYKKNVLSAHSNIFRGYDNSGSLNRGTVSLQKKQLNKNELPYVCSSKTEQRERVLTKKLTLSKSNDNYN